MQIPHHLSLLIDEGILEGVVRPLMSGKEAQVYLVRSAGELRVAKVYKQAQDRSFRQRSSYTEGRTVRNTRDQRAMDKRTRHGREQDEAAWRAAEVDVIHRLHAAGVRVPTPHQFIDGMLIMELVTDSEGNPAPRLGDVELDRESAERIYRQLLREVVRMLCAGVVHGDLSDFNVLLAEDGPVIIDFPQAVEAAKNTSARRLLLRDVDNLHRFYARYAPGFRPPPYAEEIWQLYERGELTPDVQLHGRYRRAEGAVDTSIVLDLIADADRDERKRRSQQGLGRRGMPNHDHRGPTPTPNPPPSERNRPQAPTQRSAPPVAASAMNSRAQSSQAPSRQAPQPSLPAPHEMAGRPVVAAVDTSTATNGQPPLSKASKRRRRRRRAVNKARAGMDGGHNV